MIEAKAEGKDLPPAKGGTTVYVTKTGTKYHVEGCSFLAKSMIAVTVEEARKRGCGPCSACNLLK